MKRFSLVTIVVLGCAFGAILQALPRDRPDPAQPDKTAVNVAGKWAMTLEMGMGSGTPGLDCRRVFGYAFDCDILAWG